MGTLFIAVFFGLFLVVAFVGTFAALAAYFLFGLIVTTCIASVVIVLLLVISIIGDLLPRTRIIIEQPAQAHGDVPHIERGAFRDPRFAGASARIRDIDPVGA